MKIEDGKTYQLKDGTVVKVRRNSLPYYCFSAVVDHDHYLYRETWTESGRAFHDDCGFSIVAQVK